MNVCECVFFSQNILTMWRYEYNEENSVPVYKQFQLYQSQNGDTILMKVQILNIEHQHTKNGNDHYFVC